MNDAELLAAIRVVPDYPEPGIDFYDITTLMKSPEHLRAILDRLPAAFEGHEIAKVVGIEARGFLFAPTVAHRLGCGFVPVRKAGKLPSETLRRSYGLEYGRGEVEMHRDAVHFDGEPFLIIDDVLATGGTARAAAHLVEELGGRVAGFGFVLEIAALEGRAGLGEVRSLLRV